MARLTRDLTTWRGSACSPRHASAPARERVEIGGATVGDVLDAAVERYGERLGEVIGVSAIWLNGEAATRDMAAGADDEVAVLPPVSGG